MDQHDEEQREGRKDGEGDERRVPVRESKGQFDHIRCVEERGLVRSDSRVALLDHLCCLLFYPDNCEHLPFVASL